jgi:hypothetical protein
VGLARLLLLAFVMAFLLESCSNFDKKQSEFREIKHLKAEMVNLKEIISPDFMTLKGNCLVISSSKSNPSLFAYSTPPLEFMSEFGIKGGGPEEIKLFPMFCESPGSAYLYVWGYAPVTIKKMSISESGEVEDEGDITLKAYEAFNNMAIIRDSLFVFYLPDHLTVKKYDLVNKTENSLTLPTDNHRESYFYSNRGSIATSESTVVYSYLFKRQIDLYDLSTLKLKTRISDGKSYPKPAPGDFSSLVYHYVGLYAGEKYFYALYDGGNEAVLKPPPFLEVYDYEGNPIIKYSFDIPPHLFVVDEDRGKIYGFNHGYEDGLIWYDLE